MALHVTMKNPKTGELKQIKVGWSWVLFFFSGFLGFPLFLRRLYVWGGVFLALWVVNFLGPMLVHSPTDEAVISSLMFCVFLGLEIWIGVKGNEMTAKNYLENDWVFVEPESDVTKLAKTKWGIAA